MDRFELKRFLDEDQAQAHKWRDDAEKRVREAERIVEDFNAYVLSVGKSNLTDEEREQYKEARELLQKAREDLIFYDGVEKGKAATAQLIRGQLAMEELANAGRFVPRIVKPKRR